MYHRFTAREVQEACALRPTFSSILSATSGILSYRPAGRAMRSGKFVCESSDWLTATYRAGRRAAES